MKPPTARALDNWKSQYLRYLHQKALFLHGRIEESQMTHAMLSAKLVMLRLLRGDVAMRLSVWKGKFLTAKYRAEADLALKKAEEEAHLDALRAAFKQIRQMLVMAMRGELWMRLDIYILFLVIISSSY